MRGPGRERWRRRKGRSGEVKRLREPVGRSRPHRRVMFFVTSPTTVDAFVRPIAQIFAIDGWAVDIVSAPGDGLDATAGELGATPHPLPLRRGAAPVALGMALLEAVRLVRRVRPTLVISATPVAGLLGVLAGRAARTEAKVLHLAWGLRSESLRSPFKQVVRRLEILTSALADMTIANSRSLADAIATSARRQVEVSVLGEGSSHGVDLHRFAFCPAAVNARPVVGYVGRIRRDKGILELLEAVEILHQRGLSFETRIVGTFEEPDLAERVAATPGTSHVAFASNVPTVMAELDVLCLPTWREGFPNVVLEAAAVGRPVVTTTATGAVDSVVDGKTGLLVPPRDSAALAEALERLLRSPDLRARMGEAGRRRVEAHFDRDAVCRRLVAASAQLCGVEEVK